MKKPNLYQRIAPEPFRRLARRCFYAFRTGLHVLGMDADRVTYVYETLVSLEGRFPQKCPVCGVEGRFRAVSAIPHLDSQCPQCGSMNRHRLIHLTCISKGHFDGKTLLHFAPDTPLVSALRERAATYVTADIGMEGTDLALDIERLGIADHTFDAVIASHVLEHVDDSKALGEIYRILRPGGSLYAMVPIVEGWSQTYENEGIETEEDRELHFGQFDHLRYYGRDFRRRLEEAGFSVSEYEASGEDTALFGLLRGERVFVCKKELK